jgi:MerR family transcriptional regulator, thiopeptide resistance regulator
MSLFEPTSHRQELHQQDEKHDEYRQGHELIAKNLADLMRSGKEIADPDAQHWIGKHYEFVCQFWKPNKMAYKSLALTYVMDPAFKATYESFEPGLAKYIQTAINIWANQNLD